MKIIASYSIKGGVGKTAASVNLAYAAAKAGNETLLVDLDPQGASSFYFRIGAGKKEKNSDERAQEHVDSLSLVCQKLGKDPDQIAQDAARRAPGEDSEVLEALVDALNERGVTEREKNIRYAHIMIFLDSNDTMF